MTISRRSDEGHGHFKACPLSQQKGTPDGRPQGKSVLLPCIMPFILTSTSLQLRFSYESPLLGGAKWACAAPT
jgi:hypothetical protein